MKKLITYILAWIIYAIALLVAPSLFSTEVHLRNETAVDGGYAVSTLSPLYTDAYGDQVRENSDVGYFYIKAGESVTILVDVAQFVVVSTPVATINVNGCTYAKTVVITDRGAQPLYAVYGKGQYVGPDVEASSSVPLSSQYEIFFYGAALGAIVGVGVLCFRMLNRGAQETS